MPRLLLVLPTSTYRAADFLEAARALGVEVVVASEEEQALSATMGDKFVRIDLCDPAAAASEIASKVPPIDGIVGVDEQGVMVAAEAAAHLGMAHNSTEAVSIARDKARTRDVLGAAGLRQPRHATVLPSDDVEKVAADVRFPCVVKPTSLSASRGVIRVDTPEEASAAAERVRAILAAAGEDPVGPLLVEEFVPGAEVAVEGLLRSGALAVLAIFDKPDPLNGPYFEETIYVTPSRLSAGAQEQIARTVQSACTAIGLAEGPIHAELRTGDGDPVVLEVAARSIGGLCSRALRFGAGISLEEVVLRHALGRDVGDLRRAKAASGVMMIPIPRSGVLREVGGREDARKVAGIDGLEITVPVGRPVAALPEGDRYLGFLFASGEYPEEVERALREAHARLRVVIEGP
ncbi:MAG: ATP-grasp domain-containing protein [Actinomycetota bacterium]